MFADRSTLNAAETRQNVHLTVDVSDVVQHVEFSPFDSGSSTLLAFVTSERICIGTCRFQAENPDVEGVEYTSLRDFHHSCRVTSFAWSPLTNLISFPKVIQFVVAENDSKIRLFTSDLQEDNQVQELGEHKSYVNSVSVEPVGGQLVASTGDDNTCRLWSRDSEAVGCFRLGSPGMKVCWHHLEQDKLMVAEKNGVVRFYNVTSQSPITSLDCGKMPLISADWCLSDPLKVVTLAGYDLFIFDTSRSSMPVDQQQAHSGCGSETKWGRSNGHLLASIGTPAMQIKVFNVKSNQVCLNTQEVIANGLTWHPTLPIVAVGGDKQIHFWHIAIL